jgi:uncharacterized protein GlcG (DUF336 family)
MFASRDFAARDIARIETALAAELAGRNTGRAAVAPRSPLGFSLADSLCLATRAETRARQVNVPVCICVADAEGRPILFHRMEGSLPASTKLAVAKAWTAAAYRMGSDELGLLAQPGGMLFGVGHTGSGAGNGSGEGQVVLFGGGMPCRVGGTVIGAIGISGGTVAEDMEIARHAIDGFSERRGTVPEEGTGL